VSGLLETARRILFHVGATGSLKLFSSDNVHVAIKFLNGDATRLNRERRLRELEVLQLLSSVTPNDHCARLLTQFTHPGIDDDGEHLCLVTELFSSNIQDVL
jgi:serine/threonine-protein kinase SRPK3